MIMVTVFSLYSAVCGHFSSRDWWTYMKFRLDHLPLCSDWLIVTRPELWAMALLERVTRYLVPNLILL